MKSIYKLSMLALLVAAIAFTGCKKEVPSILNMFKVTLTLAETTPFSVGPDATIEINARDSALIEYTIASPEEDMYMVCLYKTGGNIPIQKIPITDAAKRRSFSGSFKFYARDIGAGVTSYRIWALDKNGVYLGDGYKTISIHVNSDINYFSNRKLFLPDSIGKQMPCYLSLNDGSTYSYTTGATHSDKIDIGLYRKFELVSGVLTERLHIYSLSANPLPFNAYDISSWTKRGTLFSAPVTSSATAATFRTRFNTGVKLEAEARAVNINLTSSTVPLATNQFIFFKTPEGKYGVMFIQSFNFDYDFNRYVFMAHRIQQ